MCKMKIKFLVMQLKFLVIQLKLNFQRVKILEIKFLVIQQALVTIPKKPREQLE